MPTQSEIPSPAEDPSQQPVDQLRSTRPSKLRLVFVGTEGLRAGWSILIFFALFAAFLFTAHTITIKVHPPTHHASSSDPISLTSTLLNESVPLLGVIFISWIMSKIERRSSAVYGFGGTRRVPQFFAGLAWGFTCLSLLIFTLYKTGLLIIDRRLLFGSDVIRYGAGWLLGFLLVGLLEEYITRGYLQYTLSRGFAGLYQWAFKTPHSKALGFWTAAIVFSILFGLGHGSNPGESPIGLLSAGLAAMVFCLSLWRTGSLWWAIGFHATWDWAQSFLYGVADSGTMVQFHLLATHPIGKPLLSGGTTGPEGSILVIPILALITAIIFVTLPKSSSSPFIPSSPPPAWIATISQSRSTSGGSLS